MSSFCYAIGGETSGQGFTGSISSNGQVAVFFSIATNLVRVADANEQPDVVFRRLPP